MIGENIRKKRLEMGLTQASLAKGVEAAQTYISQLELGKTKPSMEMVRRLAETLQCNSEDILNTNSGPELKTAKEVSSHSLSRHSLAYWATVVDNARAAASNEGYDELEEIKLMLDKALDAVEDSLGAE